MKLTLIRKLSAIFLCMVMVSLISVSWVYYGFFTKHVEDNARKQQETAFELIFDHVRKTVADITPNIKSFNRDPLEVSLDLINSSQKRYDFRSLNDADLSRVLSGIFSRYRVLMSEVNHFASSRKINKLVIYDEHDTARVVYLQFGIYLGVGVHARYIPYTTQQLTDLGDQLIKFLSPEELWGMVRPKLPKGVNAHYPGSVPENDMYVMGHLDGLPTIRFRTPVKRSGIHSGLLEIEIALLKEDVHRFAGYSHTDINIFVEDRFGIGTLPDYRIFDRAGELKVSQPDFKSLQLPAIHYSKIFLAGRAYLQGSIGVTDVIVVTANYPEDDLVRQREALLVSIGSVVVVIGCIGILVSGLIGARVNRFVEQVLYSLKKMAQGDIPEKLEGVELTFRTLKTRIFNFHLCVENIIKIGKNSLPSSRSFRW